MSSIHPNGSILQVWLPRPLDDQFRKYAADERRSLSGAIRLAVEDALEENFAGATVKADSAPASVPSASVRSRSGAGSEEG